MSYFEELKQQVQSGIEGNNGGIPIGFPRLNNYISIRRAMYYLIGGYTGSGKTSFVDDCFVLNPYLWWRKNRENTNIDLKIIYWSMERKTTFKLAKWVSRQIFLEHGIIIPVNKLMGWTGKEHRLTSEEHDYFLTYEDFIEEMLETCVSIMDFPENPTGKRNFINDFAKKRGHIEEVGEFKKVYIPNNPNEIVLVITDHVGLHKKEKNLNTKKEIIDKTSEDNQRGRDFMSYSYIDISQLNRDIANPIRIKNGDVEVQMEDFKETGNICENADIVLGLFDPMRYKVADPSGYELEKLRSPDGSKRYRSLKILKNSYGSEDVRIGLGFQPVVGHFAELPKRKEITEADYAAVLDNSYFLK